MRVLKAKSKSTSVHDFTLCCAVNFLACHRRGQCQTRREMGSKLTIAGNGNRVCNNSYGEEGKDLGEEVHDVVDVKGGVEGVEEEG
jgi:hypothetical protein